MKRRKFIKSTGIISASALVLPSLGFNLLSGKEKNKELLSFTLKGFDEEHEENPSLVSNGNGEMWMFSLRRLHYPKDTELISSFHFDGEKWSEIQPVTKSEGHYEVPVSSCCKNGKPVVAWNEIVGDKWKINAVTLNENGFSKPYTFPVKSGRSINPVIISPSKNRNWIVWENWEKGKFSIYISKYEDGNWS
ncbi:MAG: hypothetical protein R3250_18455, partial [Melioribacteraceae bacterium]|nr:hypothetical protein [Melioribacteraceae bacterium]